MDPMELGGKSRYRSPATVVCLEIQDLGGGQCGWSRGQKLRNEEMRSEFWGQFTQSPVRTLGVILSETGISLGATRSHLGGRRRHHFFALMLYHPLCLGPALAMGPLFSLRAGRGEELCWLHESRVPRMFML